MKYYIGYSVGRPLENYRTLFGAKFAAKGERSMTGWTVYVWTITANGLHEVITHY